MGKISEILELYAKKIITFENFNTDESSNIKITVFGRVLSYAQQIEFMKLFRMREKLQKLAMMPRESIGRSGDTIPTQVKIRDHYNMEGYHYYPLYTYHNPSMYSDHLNDFNAWENYTRNLTGLPKAESLSKNGMISKVISRTMKQISESSHNLVTFTEGNLDPNQSLSSLPNNSLVAALCAFPKGIYPFPEHQTVYFPQHNKQIVLLCLSGFKITPTNLDDKGLVNFYSSLDHNFVNDFTNDIENIIIHKFMKMFTKDSKVIISNDFLNLITLLDRQNLPQSIYYMNPDVENRMTSLGDFDRQAISLATQYHRKQFGHTADSFITKFGNMLKAFCKDPQEPICKIETGMGIFQENDSEFCTTTTFYFATPKDNGLQFNCTLENYQKHQEIFAKTRIKPIQIPLINANNNTTEIQSVEFTENNRTNYFGINILRNFVSGFISSGMHLIVDKKFNHMTDIERQILKIFTDFPLNYMTMGESFAYSSAGVSILSILSPKMTRVFQTIGFIVTLYNENEEDKVVSTLLEMTSLHLGSFVFSQLYKHLEQNYWVNNVAGQGPAPAQNIQFAQAVIQNVQNIGDNQDIAGGL